MSFTIVYLERAIKEYESALEWYMLQSELAALNFRLAMDERINLLRNNPMSFKRTYKFFHEVSTKKYPFSIIYLVDEIQQSVIIFSIFHHSRNPKSKYKS